MYQSAAASTKGVSTDEVPKAAHAQYSNKPQVASGSGGFMKGKGPQLVPKFQSILVQRFRKALAARGGRGIVGL